jgi:predicted kinase
MRVIFVTGPAFSGKSIFIGQNYPEAKLLSMETFVTNIYGAESNDQMKLIGEYAHLYCREGLQNMIRMANENDIIIFEHIMLKKETRKFFLEAVREVTSVPVEIVVMCPSEKDLEKMFRNMPQLLSLYRYEEAKMEKPDLSEGFGSVSFVRPLVAEME